MLYAVSVFATIAILCAFFTLWVLFSKLEGNEDMSRSTLIFGGGLASFQFTILAISFGAVWLLLSNSVDTDNQIICSLGVSVLINRFTYRLQKYLFKKLEVFFFSLERKRAYQRIRDQFRQ